MQVVIKIKVNRAPFAVCSITSEHLLFTDKKYYKAIGVPDGETGVMPQDGNTQKRLQFRTNAYFLQPFVKCLTDCVNRTNVILYLNKLCGSMNSGFVQLKLILKPPDQEIIDYAWNDRMLRLLWTKLEIENAFSWLSTLGGAYSALGDYFDHCAEEAGRISARQLKLSRLLGDEGLAARSKLYSALALSQKGKLQTSRHIVRNINNFAIETRDKRLNRMCQGVWAKLKYLRAVKNGKIQGSGDFKESAL